MTTSLDPLALFRLDGKVAVVTGASSGLGDRFARVLDAVGARVVIAARRADRLEALAADLTDAVVVPADLAQPADRERLVRVALDTCGRLDVLVNNAGIGRKVSLEDEPLDDFRAHDGDQRHGDLAPLPAARATRSSRTAGAASSTSRRCSATSARRR